VIGEKDLDLFIVTDDPQVVVDKLFDYYANRSITPNAHERALEMTL
jgi:hypothetical protein